MPTTYITNTGQPRYSTIGPTADRPPVLTPGLQPAINDLLTPGLVPDIARQSAEVSAGRGIPGSPAGDSTAVRMSEQNYLQRLGLANTLLSGEAGRNLPYQITPYQQAWLDFQRQLHTKPGGISFGGGGGGGGGGAPVPRPNTPWASFEAVPAVRGTRPDSAGSGGGIFGGGGGSQPIFPGGPTLGGGDEDLDYWLEWFGFDAPGNTPGGGGSSDPTTDTPFDWTSLDFGG